MTLCESLAGPNKLYDLVTERMHEPVNERTDGWMDGWVGGWVGG